MAGPLSELDFEELIDVLTEEAQARFEKALMPPELVEENGVIIQQFNQIASNLITQEGGIEMPGTSQQVAYDAATGAQALSLFSEGVCHALLKCQDFGLEGEPKSQIIQNMALEVFNQAKQITAMTFGQELTPEIQIPRAQQAILMQQSAEGHLIHFLHEYERKYGPLLPPETEGETGSGITPDSSFDEEATLPSSGEPSTLLLPEAPTPVERSIPSLDSFEDDEDDWFDRETDNEAFLPPVTPTKPPPSSGSSLRLPSQKDKYAAVALLLNTLDKHQQERVLANFNPEEHKLIRRYEDPAKIAAELDLASVEKHLKHFKTLLEQGGTTLRSKSYRGIRHLTQVNSREKVLSCIQKERPRIKHFVSGLYQESGSSDGRHFEDLLPPKIEEALFQHLSQVLPKR